MKNSTTKYGLGIAAIAAVLTLGMVAVSLQDQLAEAEAANKGGFATNQIVPVLDATPDNVPNEPALIAWYHFKSSNFNEWGANFIAECATATHIQGKGKMDNLEGAKVGAQVFFTHVLPDGTENVVHIDGTEESYNPADVPPEATWNMCSQTFEIKTYLNDVIYECTEADTLDASHVCYNGDIGDLRFACDVIENEDGSTTEICEQYVELFLENAGTHPAKAFVSNVPHGDNAVKVYAIFDAESQELDGDKTGVTIGKRMLDVYPVIADNNNNYK